MAKQKKTADPNPFSGKPQLVVVASSAVAIRVGPTGALASAAGASTDDIAACLAKAGASLRPLFGLSEERLERDKTRDEARFATTLPRLSVYYTADVDPDGIHELAAELRALDSIEAAYVKPPAIPAIGPDEPPTPTDTAPPATPSFESRQGYLDASPTGIDARWAWTQSGGRGCGVRIIDVEGAWRFGHEDLKQLQGGVIFGTQTTQISWRNHGTAVISEFSGDRNDVGVTGICPEALVSAASIFGDGSGSAEAIRAAADRLVPGDVLLIELHRAGPRHNYQSRLDQRGYIAVEWWPDDLDAIRYATGRGIIVVAAAGNGAEDLDDSLYDTRPVGFPSSWVNPFLRQSRHDSGSIIVGAGAPPPGTHGNNHGPDRSRLGFSNYGSCVDAQGWGREVTACGYGDLQGGTDEDLWYTDIFSGTSSASPIVVGAVASVQGILRARGHTLLTPAKARACLRSTGAPQQDAPARPATQRIGNRPNIPALLRCITNTRRIDPKQVKDLLDAQDEEKQVIKEIKEKEVIKELKDKEVKEKEIKEFKEKEFKEVKEFKEKDKDMFENFGDDWRRQDFGDDFRREDFRREDFRREDFRREDFRRDGFRRELELRSRLQQIEQQLAKLSHFIPADLRPDLSTSALPADGAAALGQDVDAATLAELRAKNLRDT